MTKSIVCLAAFLVCLAACGLQAEQQAEVIEEVQFELLGTTTSTTSTTVPESPVFSVTFYWHTAGDNNRLQAITRVREEPPTAGRTLSELVLGPTQEDLEADPNLQNLLDPSMEPQLSQVEGSIYQIQIQWPIDDGLNTEEAAEFVCTATQFPEIAAITIVNTEGEQFSLSGTGAVAIAGPARASDFNDCEEDPLPVDPDAEVEGDTEVDPDAETTTTTG